MKIDAVLNRKELLDRVSGDVVFLQELIDLFIDSYPELIKKIDQAIQNEQSQELQNAAHELKGVVGNFCAPEAVTAIQKMQVNGKNADFSSSSADFGNLMEILSMVENALKKLIEEYTSQKN